MNHDNVAILVARGKEDENSDLSKVGQWMARYIGLKLFYLRDKFHLREINALKVITAEERSCLETARLILKELGASDNHPVIEIAGFNSLSIKSEKLKPLKRFLIRDDEGADLLDVLAERSRDDFKLRKEFEKFIDEFGGEMAEIIRKNTLNTSLMIVASPGILTLASSALDANGKLRSIFKEGDVHIFSDVYRFGWTDTGELKEIEIE